jgi:tetratricopeptide (TPR) repeat protein
MLALNYIREYRGDYAAVFWIEAGSKESIERDYVQIYRLLYNRQMDAGPGIVKVEDAVPAVKRWFHGREGRWLVVLDSADTIDNDRDQSYIDLGYFMPDAPRLHVIVTSRSSTAKEMTTPNAVEVGEMEPSEATELFQRYAKMTEEGPDVTREVDEIVNELGYLALAITLAGLYVSVTDHLSSNIREFLPEYRQRRKELLQRRPKQHIHRYGESVLSTWEASFEAIENHGPAAARLLNLLAFVNFEDIFMGLFDGDGAGEDSSAFTRVEKPSEVTRSPDETETWRMFLFCGQKWTVYDLRSAFETLQTYSLIQWKSDRRSYTMHKLVHAWGQDRLEADRQQQLSGLALELMADASGQDGLDPSRQLRLVPHVMASFGVFSLLHKPLDELVMNRLAMIDGMEGFLYRIGRWSEAYNMRLFHFRKIKKILGKEHPDTLRSMNNLALVLSRQGNYKEAEPIHRQVLALYGTVLGKEHPDTLTSMNNLAEVLSSQGSYKEAERIHRQALTLKETVLGKEHPDTLTIMNNLASVFRDRGKYEAAEQMNRRALERTPLPSSSIFKDSDESDSSETASVASSTWSESSKSSASSHASASGTLVAALDEVITDFMSDEQLRCLFAEAFIKQDRERVSRNGARLLKWLGRRLVKAANTPVEKETAKFFLAAGTIGPSLTR